MKLPVNRIRKNIPFTLAFALAISVILFSNSYEPALVPDYSPAQLEIVNKFKELCHRNELIIDSIKKAVNNKFNFPIDIYVDPIEEDRICDPDQSVPYYGMSDGNNAFIFSLHKKEIHTVNIYYNGDGKYTISGGNLYFPFEVWVRVPKNENYTSFFDAQVYYLKKNRN